MKLLAIAGFILIILIVSSGCALLIASWEMRDE